MIINTEKLTIEINIDYSDNCRRIMINCFVKWKSHDIYLRFFLSALFLLLSDSNVFFPILFKFIHAASVKDNRLFLQYLNAYLTFSPRKRKKKLPKRSSRLPNCEFLRSGSKVWTERDECQQKGYPGPDLSNWRSEISSTTDNVVFTSLVCEARLCPGLGRALGFAMVN